MALLFVVSFSTVHAQSLESAKAELRIKTEEYIRLMAVEYFVDPDMAVKVAMCESQLNHLAVGDKGNSYGIWQIFLKYHPLVTKEMAIDPIESTKYAMPLLKETPEIWTCWKVLYN